VNQSDIKQFIIDTVQNGSHPDLVAAKESLPAQTSKPVNTPKHKIKKKMEFSKKLMVFSSLMYAATWAVTMYSWFVFSTIPDGLKEMATWLFGATVAFYNAKSVMDHKFNYPPRSMPKDEKPEFDEFT